jgi:hypothetical protein
LEQAKGAAGDGDSALGSITLTLTAPTQSGSPALALTEGPGSANSLLTLDAVQRLLGEAIRRWSFAGVDTSGLPGITVGIGDLSGATLAMAFGSTITLDVNAAGWGWSLDANPVQGRRL